MIHRVWAYEVLDSRGAPTLEVEVRLASGARGAVAVPAGLSTGSKERKESRDGERRYRGRGVRHAARVVRTEVADALHGMDALHQAAVDARLRDLDGTPDKSRLGANAILGASLATAHAAAAHCGVPLWRHLTPDPGHVLPVPMLNVLNGGAHARGGMDVQELMLVPWGAESFADALRIAVQIYWTLGDLLAEAGIPTSVGDEGGYAPRVGSTEDALDMLMSAVERAGLEPGVDVALALDAAASGWRHDAGYRLRRAGRTLSRDGLIDFWEQLVEGYPIVALEDPMAEDDREGWSLLHERLGDRVQLIGDDVFVTDPELVSEGIAADMANAVLVKPNQIGTLSETLATIEIAHAAGWATVVSHRSGETTDTTIADLAVGAQVGQIKAGAPCRGERVAKYNRLMRIEEELGDGALFAGRAPFGRQRTSKSG
ncbi:MAG TPA: phosphopyruvate hydratase [Baekduia sp.]|uniref:phosphopyruvate hydratase n=1 Tax=Baekduia sp. TaxID=2600305 RepID=UPI002D782D75|nr:phosphopyruvate hydratase [Baekduia sp.]HET6506951.1 phosphopyruvate hydratase [Baekduia sp.]